MKEKLYCKIVYSGKVICWKDVSEGRRRMPKRYAKYGLLILSRDYLVVWETMMVNI